MFKLLIVPSSIIAYVAYILLSGVPNGYLEIFVLDVGQGDSILIKSPDGYYGLIDGSRGNEVLTQLAKVMPLGVNRLEFVIATHPDADHVEGLVPVLESFEVKNIFWEKIAKDSTIYLRLVELVKRSSIPNFELKDIHDFRFGCCVDMDILWPLNGQTIYDLEEPNNGSLSLMLRYKGFNMFFGGDLGLEQEEEIFAKLPAPGRDLDVLKVSHHGSRTSSSEQFLRWAQPEISIISFGKDNSYGHPHSDVIAQLKKHANKIYMTGGSGLVALKTDGQMLRVSQQGKVEEMKLTGYNSPTGNY